MRYFQIHLILFTLCFLISTAASAGFENLVHKTHAQRIEVLGRFYNDTLSRCDSVTAWNHINRLNDLARKNSDEDLLMESRVMEMFYYARRSHYPMDFVVAKIESVKEEAVNRNKIWAQVMAENSLAGYYYGQKYYELAFVHSEHVYQLVRDIKVDDFPFKQLCLANIGTRYFRFGDYGECLSYFKLALASEPKFTLNHAPKRLDILNTIGLAYQKLGLLDSSDIYFNTTYTFANAIHDTAFQGISSGNLGHNLFLRKEYDRALPLLQKDVDIALYRNDWGLASGSLMIIGEISLAKGNINAAQQQLEQVKALVFKSKQLHRLPDLYPILAKLHAAKSQPALASLYMDSAFYWKDSVARRFSAQQILRARQKIELDKVNAEMILADSRRKHYELQRNALIAFILMAAGGAIYFYRMRSGKVKLQKALLQKTKHELVTATRQLKDFAKSMAEKNEIIEFLEEQNNQDNDITLEKLHKSTILTDDDWEYYRELFEKVHPGFFDRLRIKLPGLTPAETRFMALSKLDLTAKEMSKILGVGPEAIRQYRSRVRRKMQLGDEEDIKLFVTSV